MRLTPGGSRTAPGPADRVVVEPGEQHWHGATADRVVTWLDHVTDDEHGRA